MKHIPMFTATFAVGVALATLAGCSGDGSSNDGEDPQGVTLTLLATNPYKDAIDELVSRFEEQNSGIVIDVSYTDDNSITSTLPQQLAAGNAADLFTVWPGTYSPVAAGNLAARGFVLELSDEEWAADVPDSMSEFVGADGGIYYPPLVSLPIITIYNEGALDDLGLAVPTTWSEVLQLCVDARDAGVTAYALGAQSQSQNQMLPFVLIPTLVDRTEPTFMADRAAGTTMFADSPWVDVFDRVDEMNNAGCFDQPLGTDTETAQDNVASGRSLGMFGPSSYYGVIQDKMGDSTSLVVGALPATDDPDETWLPLALGSAFGVNAATDHPDEAKAFIAFLMSPDATVTYAEVSGQPPALPNDAYEPNEATSLAVAMNREGKTAPVPDQLFPSPEIRDAWIVATQEMLGDAATPLDVASAMDEAWQNTAE